MARLQLIGSPGITDCLWIAPAIHRAGTPRSASMRIDLDDTEAVTYALTQLRDVGALGPASILIMFGDQIGMSLDVVTAVDDVPRHIPLGDRTDTLRIFAEGARRADAAGALLAVCRPGTARVCGEDFVWHDAFAMAMVAEELVVHGVYVVTDDQVLRVNAVQPLT